MAARWFFPKNPVDIKSALATTLGLLTVWTMGTIPAFASTPHPLPYSIRTQNYSGWSNTVRGDIRTVGMAGAMVGLADSFLSSSDNPAGLAMTQSNIAVQITGNTIQDEQIQDFGSEISTTNFGAAANLYPWGFSLGYFTPQSEGQVYDFPSLNDTADAEVTIRELKISIARLFLRNRLAIGASLNFGQGIESLDFNRFGAFNTSHHSYAVGASVGGMYQLPHRILVGLAYHSAMDYVGSKDPTPGVSGFFQPIQTPARIQAGAGWIPNRFFRLSAGLYGIGATPYAAQLADNSRRVGESFTIQPRVGAFYILAEYPDFTAELSAGTYYEVSRVHGYASRMHETAGVELNPYIFNFGFGIDRAYGYKNVIFSAGIDLIRFIRKLDLIPPLWHAPYGGFLPPPTYASDIGLPRPLNRHYVSNGQSPDVIKIGLDLPSRVEDKIDEIRGLPPGSSNTPQALGQGAGTD